MSPIHAHNTGSCLFNAQEGAHRSPSLPSHRPFRVPSCSTLACSSKTRGVRLLSDPLLNVVLADGQTTATEICATVPTSWRSSRTAALLDVVHTASLYLIKAEYGRCGNYRTYLNSKRPALKCIHRTSHQISNTCR